jgi:hypothetical protein
MVCELAPGDLADPNSIRRANAVERVFLASPNDPRQVEYETNVIDAAVAARVRRIVKLSALSARVERRQHLPRSFSNLRPSSSQGERPHVVWFSQGNRAERLLFVLAEPEHRPTEPGYFSGCRRLTVRAIYLSRIAARRVRAVTSGKDRLSGALPHEPELL